MEKITVIVNSHLQLLIASFLAQTYDLELHITVPSPYSHVFQHLLSLNVLI